MKENKRKASKRKERRSLKSCCRVLQEIIGSKDVAAKMIAKVDNDFSFMINDSDIIPEKLLTVKPKVRFNFINSTQYLCVSGKQRDGRGSCKQHGSTEHTKEFY